jgi:hypothetical protein
MNKNQDFLRATEPLWFTSKARSLRVFLLINDMASNTCRTKTEQIALARQRGDLCIFLAVYR